MVAVLGTLGENFINNFDKRKIAIKSSLNKNAIKSSFKKQKANMFYKFLFDFGPLPIFLHKTATRYLRNVIARNTLSALKQKNKNTTIHSLFD